ncbi:MAG: hypothetical protein JW902_18765, partial [Syntrophaceae bacterium]|nr:hypothetical protein [Syntrophaceae bacterium]
LHLGASGAQALKSILPPDSDSYLSAASFLLSRNDGGIGRELMHEGESLRRAEMARLWSELKETGPWLDKSENRKLCGLASLDRNHPGVLLLQGDLMSALKQIDRRGETIGSWQDTRAVFHFLKTELDADRGDKALQTYYLGKLVLEEGDEIEAEKWLRKSMNYNTQHFPTWITLRDVMKRHVRNGGDQLELDTLNAKIDLFAMTGVVSDAWKWSGLKNELPAWRAPVRVANPVSGMTLRFSAIRNGSWALYLDGRFVEVWSGTTWQGRVALSILPGEHEFTLVSWNRDMADFAKVLPFTLEIGFE